MRALACIGAVLLLSSVAFAGPSPAEVKRADQLFEQGRKLMSEGKIDEACAAFTESQRLDPGGGTLLNLASCHDAQGKSVTAAAEIEEVIRLAREAKRTDAVKVAEQRLSEVSARRSFLTIVVSRTAREKSDLVIKLDDSVVDAARYDTPIAVDAGHHVVIADARGETRLVLSVDVARAADRRSIDVRFPESAQPPAPPTAVEPPAPPPAESSPSRAPAFIAFGIGAAGLATGVIAGVVAGGAWSDAKNLCPARECRSADGVDAYGRAKTLAVISDIGFGTAVAGTGVGIFLLLRRPSPPTVTAGSARATFLAGPGGVLVTGSF